MQTKTKKQTISRRQFLKITAGLSMAAAFPSLVFAQKAKGQMPYRILGQTGEKVSLVGIGGYHIGSPKISEADSIKLMRKAIDNGINFFDNCWDYNNGRSEILMGKALQDGYRQKAFLMTKIDGRTKQSAADQINESLKRLNTDHIDLMQFHEIIRLEDPDRIFAPGGAFEAVTKAKQAGKIRYIGFTGHKDPIIHLRTLDVAAEHKFRFDAVQMPLNVMDAHFRSFEKDVLPRLVKEEIGVLAMKSLGSGYILQSNAVSPRECLQYSMNLPSSVVITGIDSDKILDQAIDAAQTFEPLSKDHVASLLSKTAQPAATGKYELFKTNNTFDSTAHNPKWLG